MRRKFSDSGQTPYRLSYTAASLMPYYSAELVRLYAGCQDWEKTRAQAQAENLVQARQMSSCKRITGELVLRLRHLESGELALFLESTPQEQALLLWLAICRCYQFIGDFAADVLSGNLAKGQKTATRGDYTVYFNRISEWREELDMLADSSREKLAFVLFKFMRDANILNKKHELLPCQAGSALRAHLLGLPERERQFFPGLA